MIKDHFIYPLKNGSIQLVPFRDYSLQGLSPFILGLSTSNFKSFCNEIFAFRVFDKNNTVCKKF